MPRGGALTSPVARSLPVNRRAVIATVTTSTSPTTTHGSHDFFAGVSVAIERPASTSAADTEIDPVAPAARAAVRLPLPVITTTGANGLSASALTGNALASAPSF